MSTGRHADGLDDSYDEQEPVDATGEVHRDADAEDSAGDDLTVVRHEEVADVSTESSEAGRVRVNKQVESRPVEQTVERSIEHADTTRETPGEDDDGEVFTLPDGSVSIPVFEEVLVVTKKLVVRERIVVRKHTVIDEHVIRTELRREEVSVDAVGDIDVDDQTALTATTPAGGTTDPLNG